MPLSPAPENPGEICVPRAQRWRRLLRWALRGAMVLYILVALAVLALRHFVLPEVSSYRDQIAGALAEAIGRPVSLGEIDAQWHGLRPRLSIHGLSLLDEQGRPALTLDEVTAEVSWISALDWTLHLDRLEIDAPRLDIRRTALGKLSVAGIPVDLNAGGDSFSDWLLTQSEIVVRNAAVTWTDEVRTAPPLQLRAVNIRLLNRGARHRFALTAAPPDALAATLDIRGDLRGQRLSDVADWHGSFYVQIDRCDLAGWRQWVDYPVELPQGSGALRMWLGIDGPRIESLTADVALAGVAVRLAADLPMLELSSLSGRIAAQLQPATALVQTRSLALSTPQGVSLPPTTLRLRWSGAGAANGDFDANRLDLGVLHQLAAYLPFDAERRKQLDGLAPRGNLSDVHVSWDGAKDGWPQRFTLKARADRLALAAQASLPGVEGFSGIIDGTERAGSMVLASTGMSVDLPRIFPEPKLVLESLQGEVRWKAINAGTEFEFRNLKFHNADTSGSASGQYRRVGEGPGEIDLSAKLDRTSGGAAWRYLPFAVGESARSWLKTAIVGGTAEDARLRLKGNLKDWPFAHGRGGTFLITSRFSGVGLNYADGWPPIRDISGELRFEGTRMLITARKGKILEVDVGPTTAEIADLETLEELLTVNGQASGPTAEFLRFIEMSPVAARIDHFTEGMKASGAGALKLRLDLPLRALANSRVAGNFQLSGNTIVPDPDMPPLTAVTGALQFTGASLTGHRISAQMLGGPLSIDVTTLPDASVQMIAQGRATAQALRQQFDSPWLDHLSGATNWKANLGVRGKRVELAIDSTLNGIASSLPPPLNKSAGDALALKLERKLSASADAAAPSGSLWRIDLGTAANVVMALRRSGAASVVDRAAVGIGTRPELPSAGVVLAVDLPTLDVDAWRRALGERTRAPALAVNSVVIKAREFVVHRQKLNEFSLRAGEQQGVWLAQVASREVNGELLWQGQGKGRLRARLKDLAIADLHAGPSTASVAEDAPRELPALDVTADSFSLHGKALGKLELHAVNRGDNWRIDGLTLSNPDASFKADGEWRNPGAANARSSLNFTLETGDIGKLLERLGYANAVRRGTAKLTGDVAWSGAPTSVQYASLDGKMSVEASRGQFNKLEPGVGRLLGILSLQSLPRRITLDFRDIFSEGFAFDSISGSIDAKRGVLETRDLQIHGPAARILMSGNVNLMAETQDLRVRVQPAIGESVAVGTALVNPLAGLATLLAQKILRDPLDQIFSYEYAVSGGWSDPKVEKVAAKPVETGPNQ